MRTLFVSDAHLYLERTHLGALNRLLAATHPEKLILLGDIFDLWISDVSPAALDPQHPGYIAAQEFVQLILDASARGVDVIYVPGNHDSTYRAFAGQRIAGIRIESEIVHTAADGQRYLCLHGDSLDPLVRWPWLGVLGSIAAAAMRSMRWSLADRVNLQSGPAETRFINAALARADAIPVNGVICGHTHVPREDAYLGYWNCGDWIDHQSYVVERDDGKICLEIS